jgi:hypothetical protein
MKAIVYWAAEQDIHEQIRYLAECNVDDTVIDRLIEGVAEAKHKIGRNPLTWSFAAGSKRVRKLQIRRFRIQVFYRIREDGTPVILEFAGPGLQPRWAERLRRSDFVN